MFTDWEGGNKMVFVQRWNNCPYRKSKRIDKFLELINSYSKVPGCKVNKQKPITFLHTNNEQVELDIKTIYHLH